LQDEDEPHVVAARALARNVREIPEALGLRSPFM